MTLIFEAGYSLSTRNLFELQDKLQDTYIETC